MKNQCSRTNNHNENNNELLALLPVVLIISVLLLRIWSLSSWDSNYQYVPYVSSSLLLQQITTVTAFAPQSYSNPRRIRIIRQRCRSRRLKIQPSFTDEHNVGRLHHILRQRPSVSSADSSSNSGSNLKLIDPSHHKYDDAKVDNTQQSTATTLLRRREMIAAVIGSSSVIASLQHPHLCYASDLITWDQQQQPANPVNLLLSQPPESINLPTGMLESRVLENVLSYPPYGMESSDIIYPSWFYGTWNVASTTTSIEAPLGLSFFGTNATYQTALSEIGTTLRYESRFIDIGVGSSTGSNNNNDATTTSPSTTASTTIIADRGYNVQSIAVAALGQNSVVDIPYVSANKLTAVLSPKGSPNPLRVDLFTLNRRQEYIDTTHFHCSEVVREIVSSIGNGDPNMRRSGSRTTSTSTILKEVETTTLYTLSIGNNSKSDKENNEITIRGRQRSAKFLVPTQNDAASFRLYEMTRGKPVDVRFYDVIYTKKIKQ